MHQHTVSNSDVLAFIKAMGLEGEGVKGFTADVDTITVTAVPTQPCDTHGGRCTHTIHVDIVRE